MFIFLLILFFVKTFIFPAFEQLFQSENDAYHSIQLSLFMMNIFIYSVPITIGVASICIIGWRIIRVKLTIRQQLQVLNKIPFYYSMKKMQTSYLFAMHFSMYLQAGLSFRQVLEHLQSQEKLPIIAYYAKLLLHQLNHGLPITKTLQHLPFLDKQIAYAFEKENEQLISNDLHGFAIFISDRLHQFVMKAIAIIQPLFFTLIACFIIFIYMSLLYPMFEFMKNI